MDNTAHRAIAVVGLSAIMPDAPDAQTFWQNIKNARYSISDVPLDRWDPAKYYDPDHKAPDKTYSKIGGWVREWQWEPFKWHLPIPPTISDSMDVGQKWAVALAHAALAAPDGGTRILDRERTAVVLGNAMGGEQAYMTALRIYYPEFAQALAGSSAFNGLSAELRNAIEAEVHQRLNSALPECTEDTMPGELSNCMAGRVANLFDLKGPNYVCDAACASALAAMDAAVEGLIENEYDAVLTGGVDRNMGASSFVKFCKIGALSATGTRPYADGADGFVMGEGGAFFLLKRLADAERDGDTIYAVMRGVGGSSDGRGKGITAPNPVGQQLAIKRAWQNAGLDPSTVGLLEGHGTSTKVGDVVEFESLNAIFGANATAPGSIALGSVKSNIGHLKSGAGAAGLFKAVMALHEKVLPPSLNFEAPNPNIDFAHSPIRVNTQLRAWDKPVNGDGIRRAAVSAFGFGGTNFHAVLEEYIPGRLKAERPVSVSMARGAGGKAGGAVPKAPLQGALVLGAASVEALQQKLGQVMTSGNYPQPGTPPAARDLKAAHRLAIAFQNVEELQTRLQRAQQAFKANQPSVWKAMRTQGVFYGSGAAPEVAFMFTGQGSQYANMLADLRASEPVVAAVFAEADRVMEPLIGRPLSEIIFVDQTDSAAVETAEQELRRTEITQPAVLTVDLALTRLFGEYGIKPDMVIGHSLGEYAALVASGGLPFEDALQAVSARGRGMAEVAEDDNGLMAAVFAPLEQIQAVVAGIDGNVVIANINSNSQAVIGGATDAVQRAMAEFASREVQVAQLPVSHAFHTTIVAAASVPLREVLSQLRMTPPVLPLVSNVTGDFYPMGAGVEQQMVDMLAQQVASPVQYVKGLNTLYEKGARVFLEVGPKKALQGFADDVLGAREDALTLFSNHPRNGEIASFNQALCGLYAAGLGDGSDHAAQNVSRASSAVNPVDAGISEPSTATAPEALAAQVAPALSAALPTGRVADTPVAQDRYQQLGQLFANFLQESVDVFRGGQNAGAAVPVIAPVITGAALGLPGTERIFDDSNVQRILGGEQEIGSIPTHFRQSMVDKHITRLVKSGGGGPHFETISSPADVIKLAGRGGALDLEQDYGVSRERVEAFDVTTQLAIAAGVDALKDAGIPLVMQYRTTHVGSKLPERWMLPEQLRDDTGVIFASAFPGYDSFADELTRYQEEHDREAQLEALRTLRDRLAGNEAGTREVEGQIQELEQLLEREPYTFNRRFLFRALPMGHSQMAEYIGARGPNTHINSACASTTQAFALAEDWIRAGRCRRVLIIAADDVTSDHLLEWIGAGFLASGAAATDEVVEEAALPFDRRRHGMILGMGACGVVVESPQAAAERGLQPICEVLSTVTANSAFHGTRLNIDHICEVMEQVVAQAEQRFGLDRRNIARELLFVSHETYTPARGGSASAEVHALRQTFGDVADQIVVANTKGLTGHAMGVGIEDTVAIKALETGVVPPVANFHEQDPELGPLNLSRGGAYPIRYALRLGAGFGSQISMSLMRWTPSADGTRPAPNQLGYEYRLADPAAWQRWLQQISGNASPQIEVVQRTLRVRESIAAGRAAASPAPSTEVIAPTAGEVPPQPSAAPAAVSAEAPAGQGEDPVTEQVLAIVAQITGYPTDMLDPDLDLEADLGIDTVKQAETFAAIREKYGISRDENLQLRDYSTIARAVEFVRERCPDLAAAPVAPAVAPAPTAVSAEAAAVQGADPVTEQVLAIVAQITGYPTDMLDPELDLEADLGIDTVKQAETFAAIREKYGIPRDENLQLRDYSTIARAVEFVRERCPDLAAPTVPAELPTAAAVAAAEPQVAEAGGADPVTAEVLAIVSRITGYPTDMLDPELDLEADLGIDTVKQAETFAAIREKYGIPRDENLQLRDYSTIARAVEFVRERCPDLAAPAVPAESPTAATVAAAEPQVAEAGGADPVTAEVLAIVSRITGYPTDMLDPELDLEADLGIDTVKQAETFAAIREKYGIPRDENLQLRDYSTIARAVEFVHERRPDKGLDPDVVSSPASVAGTAPTQSGVIAGGLPQGDMAATMAMPRRVPVPMLRPTMDLCVGTGITLDGDSRVIVMPDTSGVAKALLQRLQKRGVQVLKLSQNMDREQVNAQVESWLEAGPVHGLYWLPALDAEPQLAELELEQWRQQLELRVKLLYCAGRALYEQFAEAGRFLVAATRLGGRHGYDDAGALAPMGGAVTGFTKAYSRERGDALVKVVDFAASRKTATIADALLEETLADPGAVEIGRFEERRWGVGLAEQAAGDGSEGMVLDADSVLVITGAAGSIVSAITADLAAACPGTFYLLDLAAEPDPGNADIRRVVSDREALKRDIFERLRASGERATPALVEKQIAGLERANAALSAIESIRNAGGTAHYRQLDLTSPAEVAAVMDEVRQAHGHIDVLLHAAGIEISHTLPDKPDREFDLVFDVKCDGWFNLLHASGDMALGSAIVFSSIAGRFGNLGQTDYSAANDLLCKSISALRQTRPATRGIAIDWTAWADIGMASRGSIPAMMAAAGIDMLAPAAGIPVVRHELTAGNWSGELVVAERLGDLLQERDSTGGLDVDKIAERITGPVIGRVTGMSQFQGLQVETPLSPAEQPFLYDHQIDGTPVYPGVMAIEAFAELASLMAPSVPVTAIENVEFQAPLKFYRSEPQSLYLEARFEAEGDELLAHCQCASRRTLHGRDEEQVTTHFTATVRLGGDSPAVAEGGVPDGPGAEAIGSADLYQVYFHGPAYQVVDSLWRDGDTVVGRMRADLPANHTPGDKSLLVAPRLVELCFQSAGAWEIGTSGSMALPRRIGRLVPHSGPGQAEAPAYALVHPREGGNRFDAVVIDDSGRVIVELQDYESIRYPGAIDELRLQPFRAVVK